MLQLLSAVVCAADDRRVVCAGRDFFCNEFSPGHYLVRWVRVKGYG